MCLCVTYVSVCVTHASVSVTCVCVYMVHAYMYAYVHTYIHAYMHTYMHACMHTCLHTYIHTRTNACALRFEEWSQLQRASRSKKVRKASSSAHRVQKGREIFESAAQVLPSKCIHIQIYMYVLVYISMHTDLI